MSNIFIVVIPIDYYNARSVCNRIENTKYETIDDLRNHLELFLGMNDSDENKPQFFSLTDFMEECNDELFDFDSVFISYVEVKTL